ncbi:RNA methyltransferase [Lysobacter sp. TY2-98]|uniref:RNA methyltransferase n=1 Tax=Lysobacter sp. TY2-98 TaxID=2290922 RepID=UPI000E20411A|nr:RNA methyltransferase [Lysobacter sp. TY2-98]AXK73545.1 RNA methyltransferase [Lysobacter sp. TY2-98]
MTLAADRIRIVLVGTQHPGNIGSAARAMKTMGLRRLVLVAPEKAPNAESDALAAGADDVLAQAERHDDLASALAGCTHVMGCTARSRRVALPELDPREAAVALADAAIDGDVALVFGRERTGLTNEELHLCHQAVHIPANPDYSSLNLAAAVQVLAYEVRMALLGRADSEEAAGPGDPRASHEQLEGFYGQLAETLDAIDFHKGRMPDSAMRKLRRIFNRAALDERDVRLLRGVLADAQRMARLAGDPGSTS